MRIVIAIEPEFISAPNAGAPIDAVNNFFESVEILSSVARKNFCFDVLLTDTAISALYELGRFPIKPNIENLLTMAGLNEIFSANDLTKLFHGLINRRVSLDDCTGIKDIVTIDFSLDPNLLSNVSDSRLWSSEEEFFIISSIIASGDISTTNVFLPYVIHDNNSVNVRASDIVVEMTDNSVDDISIKDFAYSLSIFCRSISIGDTIDAVRLWRDATTVEFFHLSISIAAYLFGKENFPDKKWEDYCNFYLGSEFVKSLYTMGAANGGPNSSVVLEACARIVAGIPKDELLPFRVNASKDSAQRIRVSDKATAFRTHLTKHGQGLRLMVWRLENLFVEFSNIGPKGELIIYDGNVGERFGPI